VPKKIFNYIFIAFFTILIILFATFFKPVISFVIESYTSNLLEQKVKISTLNLSNLSLKAYIQNPQNNLDAKIITIWPLKVQASYDGDINALEKYHPLSGDIKADAIVIYDGKLVVDTNSTLYDANLLVEVKELGDDWFVRVDAKTLNVDKFQEQNSFDFGLDGLMDFDLNLQNGVFTLVSSLKSQKNDDMNLDINGKFEDKKMFASASIALAEKKINLQEMLFDLDTNQISLSLKELGVYFNLILQDEKLKLNASISRLETLLEFLNYKDIASGAIDIKGEFDIKSKKSHLFISSPKITSFSQEIENVKLNIPALHISDKQLSFAYALDGHFLKKPLHFDGNLSYKKTLNIFGKSSDFKSKSSFEIDDKNVKISIKKLDIKEFLTFLEIEPIVSGALNLNAQGNFEKIVFIIDADSKLNELGAKVRADGIFITKTQELNSKVDIFTKLGEEKVDIKGDVNYKKEFKINAKSSSLGANSSLILRADKFEFYTKDLDLQRLSKAIDKPNLPFANIDFLASGDFKNIALNIRSKKLKRNMNLENIDDYLSFDLSGTYKDNILSIKDKINLHHKTDKLALKIDASISLVAPYHSNGSLIYKNDKIIVESFSLENEQIKSSFEVDIAELYLYKAAFNKAFYGPLNIKASYTDVLNIKTNSFGGELRVRLDKKHFFADIDKVEVKKVAYLFDNNSSLDSGLINGDANYEIEQKKANTHLAVSDVTIKGINIDEAIHTLDDVFNLDFINISKSIFSHYYDEEEEQQTYIPQIELDFSLENGKIKLDDVALKTEKFLIVAQGTIQESGDIEKLEISLIDKNGCAISTQDIEGNIKNPTILKTSSALLDLALNVPTAIAKTAKKIVDIAANTVDGIASFGLKFILRSDTNVTITSDVVSSGRFLEKFVYDIIMPSGCKVIYFGKVKHPANCIKDSK